MNGKILVVDDDRDFLEIMARKLNGLGHHNLELIDDSRQAAEAVAAGAVFDLALIDMTMPEMDGMALLEWIKTHSPATECIMVTAVNAAQAAVQALRKGAYDYLVKPVAKSALSVSVSRTLERKRLKDLLAFEKNPTRAEITTKGPFVPFVTASRQTLRVLMEADLHAASDVPVLITGESGTGKELLARAIHGASPRSQHPFTPVNMASLTASLFEAEFFGHTRGAFTGADNPRTGYLEHTHRGTLFLDEIGDLPLELQGKLLRVLQDGEFARLGTSQRQRADLRVIAATNCDLEKMLARKAFRKDLYYRIRGGWLHLLPLRERTDDIPLLIRHFLRRYQPAEGNGTRLDPSALERLTAYSYPGNVRELKSVVQSAVNLARGGTIAADHLPEHIRSLRPPPPPPPECQPGVRIRPLAEVEREHILRVYRDLGGNKSKTARSLGIGLNTLRRKLEAYGEA